MVISFSNDKARAQLMQEGVVHTLRLKRRKKRGKNWANSGRTTTKIADVYIKEVGHFKIANLHEYVPTSGFANLREWWHAIQGENWHELKSGNTQNTRGWLYKVTLAPEKPNMIVHYYKVHPPRGLNTVIVPFTKQDLLDRYSDLDTIPSKMVVKDLACSKGYCSWGDYTKLRIERLKGYINRRGP